MPYVLKYDSKYGWNQNEIDALVSFAYNIGSIDGLTAKGTRSRSEIAEKMMEYNSVKGVGVLRGLTRRRTAERKLFLTPVKDDTKKTQEDYLKERVNGVSYFKELENNDVDDIKEFLHKRGFGAGEPNLSKIAEANAASDEVKKALFKLAKKGLLVKPEGLNKLDK